MGDECACFRLGDQLLEFGDFVGFQRALANQLGDQRRDAPAADPLQ
jgi:hypothetical protein